MSAVASRMFARHDLGFAPCVALALLLGATPCAAAHVDYLVAQDSSGRLVTGVNDFDTNTVSLPERVFYRDLDSSFFGSDPGFSAVSSGNLPFGYAALPANTPVSFDLLGMPLYGTTIANLWYWDGQGAVSFQPATGTTLTLSVGAARASVDGQASNVTGFALQVTTSSGSMHRHPNYQLAAALGGSPNEGLYLFAEQVRMPGIQTSIPFYTILFTDAVSTAAYQSAVAWAEGHLLLPGDVNNDAVVNAQDVAVIASHWLRAGPIADANYDGIVNAQDVAMLAGHWLQVSADKIAAVPEPPTASLVTGLIATLLAARACLRGHGSKHRSIHAVQV